MTAVGRLEVLNGVVNPDPNAPLLVIPTTWTPSQLAAALVAWYKADAGITQASGLVSAIADQSGNGAPTLQQSTSTNQYQLISAAQNGLPILSPQSNTSVVYYENSSAPYAPSQFGVSSPFTLVMAFRHVATPGVAAPLFGSFAAGSLAGYFGGFSGNKLLAWRGSGSSGSDWRAAAITGSTTLVDSTSYAVVITDSGTGNVNGQTIYLNGIAETPTTLYNDLSTTDTSSTQDIGIGQANIQNQYVTRASFYEGMIVNRLLTPVEISNATAYLRQKWGF